MLSANYGTSLAQVAALYCIEARFSPFIAGMLFIIGKDPDRAKQFTVAYVFPG